MIYKEKLAGGGGEIEPPPEKGFVKAKLTIGSWGSVTRDPYGSSYVGFNSGSGYFNYGKLSPQLYDSLNVANIGGLGGSFITELEIRSDGPFYYNGIKYQGNETGNGNPGTLTRNLWDEWVSLRGQTVDVWLKS